ncbi:MAG: DUF4259 domain-containing protein [Opitutaceae bacterium]|nr:DUF4259 domain-containing protein [Opitutaceae bacterium]
MGAWSELPFGNDTACDWAYGLEDSEDLSYIEETLQTVLDAGDDYLEAPAGDEAIAAAEVVAWLHGKPSPRDAYSEDVSTWVEAHPIKPTAALIKKAIAALDRIKREPSELLSLWEGNEKWAVSVAELRARLAS